MNFSSLGKFEDDDLEKCEELKEKLNEKCDYYYNIDKIGGDRICVLCKRVGEGLTTEEGRLLYCGQNDWIHTNCALWSNEVFEEIDGSLQNIQGAISRSRHIRCTKCSKKGASIGCCNRACPEAYHFHCAKISDCLFLEDRSLFCASHKNDTKVSTKPLLAGSDFVVSRPIYVELEQKKKKYASKHDIHVMIGSLTISNLGDFEPDLSDQTSSIIPCNFQCARLFWSSTEPWRLVHYNIRTKIIFTESDIIAENDNNTTIDHSAPKVNLGQEQNLIRSDFIKDEVKEVVDLILEAVCPKEEEDTQAPADLLPPELKQAIFEDLPHDLLDGISMQDIFPKLMTLDFSSGDTKPHKEYQSKTKPKAIKLQHKKADVKKQSPNKFPAQNYVNRVNTNSHCSVILKRVTTIQSEGIKRVNPFEEKENTDDWSSAKILQLDGAGDCSESSDSGSPVKDISRNSFKRLFQSQTGRKPRILQVDGVDDSCCVSSCSSSECGSPIREGSSSWKLAQVDGAMDFCNGSDMLEENPVKCTRCHRTYRTVQSFERHLQSCSADYILSCSESDSSEEEKVGSPEAESTVDQEILSLKLEPTSQVQDFSTEIIKSGYNSPIVMNTSTDCHTQNDGNVKVISSDLFVDKFDHNDDTSHEITSLPVVENIQLALSTEETTNSNFENDQKQAVMPQEMLTYKAREMRTYSRKKKIKNCVSTSESVQYKPAMVDYQTAAQSPTLIIQQLPSHSAVSPYIESIPPQTNPNNLQYQFITAIDAQEKPQVPLTIQLQPQINIQPVMPTVFGTIIQPNGVEQLVVNTPPPTVEYQQPMYIANVNHPVYMGMETVISNTVMSSSQYVSGMMTGSSYSASTTQMFQAGKPVVDLPHQSYIVVNTQSNNIPSTVSHNVYSHQASQPWTYNYQETYKVKERTTYQQVTKQIMQQENKMDCVKIVNSTQAPIVMDQPVIQEVTVEKTRSFQKTTTVPNLANDINPLFVNSVNNNQQYLANNGIVPKPTVQELIYQHADKHIPVIQNVGDSSNGYSFVHVVKLDKELHENNHRYPRINEIQDQLNCSKDVEKPIKPVLTKAKSNVNNSNTSVDILNKNTKPTDPPDSNTDTPKPVSCKFSQLDMQRFDVDNNVMKNNKDCRTEMKKPIRTPLKENKAVTNKPKVNKSRNNCSINNNLCNPKLVFEISSQDGLSVCSQDLAEAWKTVFETVQTARASKSLPLLPQNPFISDLRILGLDNNTVKYLVEQLPGDGCVTKYKPVYHKSKLTNLSDLPLENPSGCIRTEPHSNTRRKYDMFSWLASRHRRPPKLIVNSDTEIVNGISRRATSLNLPMAMRFRHLKETSKECVGVFRSDIHGRGLFCLRDIESGEMVIEYAGEVIRAGLTDKRENYYTSKGIGCYMFRIDDHFVVDATMHGNAARFINHSCEPNCYSRVVDILGKKHILIFALRKIPQGEELTYDYKFPLEDDKITCHCLSRKCRKYLN